MPHKPRKQIALTTPFAVRRSGLARRLGAASALLLVAILGAGALVRLPWQALTALPALLALAALACSRGRAREGTLGVDDRGLVLGRDGRERVIPREGIARGWIVPMGEFPRVVLELRNGDVVDAYVDDVAQGNDVLEASGVDVASRALRLQFGSTWRGLLLAGLMTGWVGGQMIPLFVLPFLVAIPPSAAALVALALLGGVGWASMEMVGPARVVIGADGIFVRHAFQRRFVRYAEVVSVAVSGRDIVLNLRDGRGVWLHGIDDDTVLREVVMQRIREAMTLRPGAGVSPATRAVLRREGRPLAAWRDALADLLRARGAYRATAVSRDDIERALDDPHAPAEHRVGAALALLSTGDPDAGTRVRIAADACASERLRVALERAAEGDLDDAALERALGEETAGERS